MNFYRKRSLRILFLAFMLLLTWTLRAQVIDFENFPENATPADLAAAGIMVKTGTATISNQVYYSGMHSLEIEPSDPPGEVVFSLPKMTTTDSTLFVDFRLLPTALSPSEAQSSVHAAGAKAGFLQIDGQGELYAYDAHGKGSWVATGARWITSPNGAISEWMRLTLRLDAASGTWDLYVNGQMVAADLGMDLPDSGDFTLFGDLNVPVFLDDFYSQSKNPLFLDNDQDGLPDAWEAAHRGSLGGTVTSGANLRDSASDAPGQTLLQAYFQSAQELSAAAAQVFGSHKIVLVHPSISSLTDLGEILSQINTVSPQDNPADQAFLSNLSTVLINLPEMTLAGLPLPSCPLATNINDAVAQAGDGTDIIVFPWSDPFVMANFDPQGKQINLRCLDGVVISSPESIDEGRAIQAQNLSTIISKLSAAGLAPNSLSGLWPAAALPTKTN